MPVNGTPELLLQRTAGTVTVPLVTELMACAGTGIASATDTAQSVSHSAAFSL
jgi:hypothetical protein